MSSVMFMILFSLVGAALCAVSFSCLDAERRLLSVVCIVACIADFVFVVGYLGNADRSIETIYTRRPFYERQLVNLRSSKDIHGEGTFSSQGSLFSHTASGEFSLDSYNTFRYAYRDDSGAIRFESMAIRDVAIYDNLAEGEAPYIAAEQVFGTRYVRVTYDKIGFIQVKDDEHVSDLGAVDMVYTIYVPPGTITEYLDFS